jgi:hypothetical protein
MDLAQVGDDIASTLVVVGIGDAVFRDHDRLVEAAHATQGVVQPLRVDLPAQIGALATSDA